MNSVATLTQNRTVTQQRPWRLVHDLRNGRRAKVKMRPGDMALTSEGLQRVIADGRRGLNFYFIGGQS